MELREVFKIADKDDGGSISTDELKYLLELVGLQLETADFNNLMKEIDEDGSGEIDLFEFVKMMTRKVEMNASEEQLNRAFKLFSHDDPPGTISMDHLKRLVTEFGPQHGVSDAQGVKLLKDLEAEMITLGGQFSTISEGADGRKQHFLKFPEYIPLMLAAQHKETKRRTISVGKGGYQGHDPDLGTSTIGRGSVKTFKRASVKR
jgi:calmodulin